MPHQTHIDGQTVVGLLTGLAAGVYNAITSITANDTTNTMVLAAIGAVTAWLVTECMKLIKKEVIPWIKKKLFKK